MADKARQAMLSCNTASEAPDSPDGSHLPGLVDNSSSSESSPEQQQTSAHLPGSALQPFGSLRLSPASAEEHHSRRLGGTPAVKQLPDLLTFEHERAMEGHSKQFYSKLVMQLPYDQQSPMAAVVDYRFRLHAIQLTEKDMAVVRQVREKGLAAQSQAEDQGLPCAPAPSQRHRDIWTVVGLPKSARFVIYGNYVASLAWIEHLHHLEELNQKARDLPLDAVAEFCLWLNGNHQRPFPQDLYKLVAAAYPWGLRWFQDYYVFLRDAHCQGGAGSKDIFQEKHILLLETEDEEQLPDYSRRLLERHIGQPVPPAPAGERWANDAWPLHILRERSYNC